MSDQTRLFLMTISAGFLIGCLYDVFRVLRVAVKHPNFLIQLEDVLYWAIVSFGMFYFMLNVNNGEVRAFSICGAILGMILYFASLSRLVMKMSVALVEFIKKILSAMLSMLLIPVKISLIPVRYLRNIAKQVKKPVKKRLQNIGRYVKMRGEKFSKNVGIILKKV